MEKEKNSTCSTEFLWLFAKTSETEFVPKHYQLLSTTCRSSFCVYRVQNRQHSFRQGAVEELPTLLLFSAHDLMCRGCPSQWCKKERTHLCCALVAIIAFFMTWDK